MQLKRLMAGFLLFVSSGLLCAEHTSELFAQEFGDVREIVIEPTVALTKPLNESKCVDPQSISYEPGDSCDLHILAAAGTLFGKSCPSECSVGVPLNGTCSGIDQEFDVKVLQSGDSTKVPTFSDEVTIPGQGVRVDVDAIYSCYRVKECRCEIIDGSAERQCVTKSDYTTHQLYKYTLTTVQCPDAAGGQPGGPSTVMP